MKYPWAREDEGKRSFKWGYYRSERTDFEFARQGHSPGDDRQSAEAALMDWADDVTYAVHDIDDFYRIGFVPLDRLLRDSAERRRFVLWASDRTTEDAARDGRTRSDQERIRLEWQGRQAEWEVTALRFLQDLSHVVHPSLDEPFEGTREQRAALNRLTSFLLDRYLSVDGDRPCVSLRVSGKREEIEVDIDRVMRSEVGLLKAITQRYVFEAPALAAQQRGQRRIIRELFHTLFDAAQPGATTTGLIPMSFRESLQHVRDQTNHQAEQREAARLVSDVICSMTDQQAAALYARLTGTDTRSVVEPIVR